MSTWMSWAAAAWLVATGAAAVQERDDSRSEETLHAVLQRHEAELREAIEENRIDPALDGIAEIVAKKSAILSVIGRHQSELRALLFDAGPPALNHVAIRNAASPRLSGNVVRVGAGEAIADIESALPVLAPGDLVLLGPGEHVLDEGRRGARVSWKDVAIVGEGPERTTLVPGEIDAASRLRIEGVRIECRDDPMCDLRSSGAMHLRDCYVTGYNSGAGGSNAIFGTGGSVFLVERCAFEGMTGRADSGGRSSGGRAFDLRGDYLLFVRHTQFIDNSEIVRAGSPCVFDGCISINRTRWDHGVSGRGNVFMRESRLNVNPPNGATAFAHATDDPAFVHAIVDGPDGLDEAARGLAEALRLDRNLPYWIGLLRHEDDEIRAVAAQKIKRLADLDVGPAVIAPSKEGESLRDLGVLFEAEQEAARLLDWLDLNRARLEWDEEHGRYHLRP